MQGQKKVYHYEKKNRAQVRAVLYAVVAAYVAYLGYSTTPLHGEPDGLSVTMAWVLGVALIAAGIAVAVYTYLRYRRDLADAEYTEEEYAELDARREEEDG